MIRGADRTQIQSRTMRFGKELGAGVLWFCFSPAYVLTCSIVLCLSLCRVSAAVKGAKSMGKDNEFMRTKEFLGGNISREEQKHLEPPSAK